MAQQVCGKRGTGQAILWWAAWLGGALLPAGGAWGQAAETQSPPTSTQAGAPETGGTTTAGAPAGGTTTAEGTTAAPADPGSTSSGVAPAPADTSAAGPATVPAASSTPVQPAASGAAPGPTPAVGTSTPAAVPAATASSATSSSATSPSEDGVGAEAAIGVGLDDSPLDLLPLASQSDGGLTAPQVVHRALKASPRAQIATAQSARAVQLADDAYSLFLPRVNLKASYMRLSPVPQPSPEDFFPGGTMTADMAATDEAASASEVGNLFGTNFYNRYSLQASVSIPVSEFFLTLSDTYSETQRMSTVSRLQKKGEWQAVAYDAKKAYLELARATAGHSLAVHRVGQLRRFTQEIGLLVEAGERGSVELAQSRAREASARAALERALASRRIAAHGLRIQLEMSPDEPVGVSEPLLHQLPAVPRELEPLLEQAQRDRPEVQALRELVRVRMDHRQSVSGRRYPTVALVGTANYDNPNQRVVPLRERFYGTWALGVEVAWSPTEWVSVSTELDDAELELVRARSDLSSLEDRIALEVSTAFENAHAALGALEAAQVAVTSAQETLEVRLALFHAGESTSRDVLDAELDLRVAQLDYVDNILSIHLAHAALQHAIGAEFAGPHS